MKEFIKENWWWMLAAAIFLALLILDDGSGCQCQVHITSSPTTQPVAPSPSRMKEGGE